MGERYRISSPSALIAFGLFAFAGVTQERSSRLQADGAVCGKGGLNGKQERKRRQAEETAN